MNQFIDIIAMIFLIGGAFFFLVGTIGLLRFPDFFTRMHATGKGDTLGAGMILFGLALQASNLLTSVKLILIVIFIFIANPTATHVISKAAFKSGVSPWKKEDKF